MLNLLPQRLNSNSHYQIYEYGPDGRIRGTPFSQLLIESQGLASELKQAGLRAGDRVGLAGPNGYSWILSDFTLLELGCVSVCFACDTMKLQSLEELAERYELNAILLIDGDHLDPLPAWATKLNRRPLHLHRRSVEAVRRRLDDDVFSLIFSSGTTGQKKCLMLSRRGIEHTMQISAKAWKVNGSDNVLIALPFSNVQQRTLMFMAFWYGFDLSVVVPERYFRALKDMRPTLLVGPPAFYEFAYKQHSSLHTTQRFWLRVVAILSGSAIVPRWINALRRALFRSVHERFGGCMRLMLVGSSPSKKDMLLTLQRMGLPLFEVYGLTEFGWIAFNLPGNNRVGSVGRPVPLVHIETVDGELIVSTQNPQTLGYVYDGEGDNPDVYRSPHEIATGDIGHLGGDGYLRLTGRKKNLIITSGGYKIQPEFLEAAIERIDKVRRAVVVGGGDLGVLACVIWMTTDSRPDGEASIAAEIERMNQRLSSRERVVKVLFRDETELSVESQLLTRNLKINRMAVLKAYQHLLLNA